MSAFIILAEKERKVENGKLILQIEVMAIYYESFYCLSHHITSLEYPLNFMLRDSLCPWEPFYPTRHGPPGGGIRKP